MTLNWGQIWGREHLSMSGHMLGCHNPGGGGGEAWGVGELLASSWWRSGTLLNILQCTRQPHNKNDLAPNINSVMVDESCKNIMLGFTLFFPVPPVWVYAHTHAHTVSHCSLFTHAHTRVGREAL